MTTQAEEAAAERYLDEVERIIERFRTVSLDGSFVLGPDEAGNPAVEWRGSEADPDKYLDEVDCTVNGFRFELCAECGKDLNRHVIAPGVFGLPMTWCLDGEDEDD